MTNLIMGFFLLHSQKYYVNLPKHMAKTLIQVTKKSGENSASLMRRFSRKAKESGLVKKVRSKRYSERKLSDFVLKKNALKRIERQTEREKLQKLGKIK